MFLSLHSLTSTVLKMILFSPETEDDYTHTLPLNQPAALQEWRMVVNHHVGAGNPTQVLHENGKGALNHWATSPLQKSLTEFYSNYESKSYSLYKIWKMQDNTTKTQLWFKISFEVYRFWYQEGVDYIREFDYSSQSVCSHFPPHPIDFLSIFPHIYHTYNLQNPVKRFQCIVSELSSILRHTYFHISYDEQSPHYFRQVILPQVCAAHLPSPTEPGRPAAPSCHLSLGRSLSKRVLGLLTGTATFGHWSVCLRNPGNQSERELNIFTEWGGVLGRM